MVLKPERRDVPQPGAGEILIRVAAAGVNRPDVLQRKGAYPPPPGASDLPGLEVAGEVAALGADVKRWRVGDQVCALTPGGGYAEYARVHETNALPMPAGFTFTEAAALPETFFTVWHNVFQRGGLKRGETLLVHGGSSGIGTTAIQLAAAFGAYVITTAGIGGEMRGLPAARRRPRHQLPRPRISSPWSRKRPSGSGADVILDMVGGDYVARNYDAAAVEGRIVQIATQGGAVASADFSRLMVKRLVHTGSTLRPRTGRVQGRDRRRAGGAGLAAARRAAASRR